MPIPIHPEPEEDICEKCCFCRSKTAFWTSLPDRPPGQQVACCPHCASRGEPEDVPPKPVWCRRERIAHVPTYGENSLGLDRFYPPAPIVPMPGRLRPAPEVSRNPDPQR
jgi:hypothetical protein